MIFLMLLAFSFTTEAQYTSVEVDKIIEASGLPASQNVIGIDPLWPGAQTAQRAISKRGAQLHVYHQGSVPALRAMLLKHKDAVSYEIDNVHQLGDKLHDWLIGQQAWQRAHGVRAKFVLKNPSAYVLDYIVSSPAIDQSLVSSFVIVEVGRVEKLAQVVDMVRRHRMTLVHTYSTYAYRTRITAPIIGNDRRWRSSD